MKRVKLLLVLSLSLLINMPVFADENSMVEMKCHVQLLGGIEHMYFAKLPLSKADKLTKQLIGRTITANNGNKDKIYKVIECVKLDSAFKGFASKQLDEKTVR